MDSGYALWVIRSWCKQCYQWLTGCREPQNAFYCPKTMSLFRFVSRSKLIWAVATHLSAGYLIRVTKRRQFISILLNYNSQSGQFNEDMIPTVGFNMRKITKGNVTIKVWDIGGQPRFRAMWERYCRGVNAIV